MPDIMHQVSIEANRSEVYEAVTTQEGLESWWTRTCSVATREGGISEFVFNDGRVKFQMRIEELDPDERVRWICEDGDPEWEGTRIVFDLYRDNSSTIVDFSHRNWQSTDGVFAMCSYDWANYLHSLKRYVETGEGNPHRS